MQEARSETTSSGTPVRHPSDTPETVRKPKLLDRLREALRSRHYSRRTEQTYCHQFRWLFSLPAAEHAAGTGGSSTRSSAASPVRPHMKWRFMEDHVPAARDWLDREDRVAREDRLARLEWLGDRMPAYDPLTFPGGWVAKYLFEEARYSFAYGQFMATVVLGLAFIERTLAALFYGAGRNDLERASVSVLLREARQIGWLTDEEFTQLDEVRTLRNPVTHFRAPLTPDTIEARAVAHGILPYSILEADARKVMTAVFHVLSRNVV